MLVITGASGLLGSNLALQARNQDRAVAVTLHKHGFKPKNLTACPIELTDADRTRQSMRVLHPTIIVHCAAATDVDWCEDHPAEAAEINTRASFTLAEISAELGARFLYISTDAVFDGVKGNYAEDDGPAPLNVYGETKLAGEREVLRTNPSALVVRVNIYGWNAQDKFSLAEWVLDGLRAGRRVPGFTDVFFTPILVNHLAEILLTMLDRKLTGLYHVGGSERISKFDFAQKAALAFGFDPKLVVPTRLADAKLRAIRAHDISMNTAKISQALDRAMPDVDSGLRHFRTLFEEGFPRQLKSCLDGGPV